MQTNVVLNLYRRHQQSTRIKKITNRLHKYTASRTGKRIPLQQISLSTEKNRDCWPSRPQWKVRQSFGMYEKMTPVNITAVSKQTKTNVILIFEFQTLITCIGTYKRLNISHWFSHYFQCFIILLQTHTNKFFFFKK